MFAIGSTAEDPFNAFVDAAQMANSAGRMLRPSRLSPSERTYIIVGVGQSMIAASENATYSPTNSTKVDNLNVYDGGVYAARDPLLGCGAFNAGGLWLSRLADKLIDADLCDRVILVPVGRGSTTVQDWNPDGFMFPNLLAASRRLSAKGLVASAYFWMQGQANAGAISRSEYRTQLLSIINGIRGHGFAAPWLLGKETYVSGVTDANIRGAIADLVNGQTILAGADTDTLGASNRYDGVHFNATGADSAGTLWKSAVVASSIAPFGA